MGFEGIGVHSSAVITITVAHKFIIHTLSILSSFKIYFFLSQDYYASGSELEQPSLLILLRIT